MTSRLPPIAPTSRWIPASIRYRAARLLGAIPGVSTRTLYIGFAKILRWGPKPGNSSAKTVKTQLPAAYRGQDTP